MKRHIISAAVLALLQAWPQLSIADDSMTSDTKGTGPYVLRGRQALMGSVGNDAVATSPYPLRKRYEEFTDEEKDSFHAFYDGMPKEDEPPFPKSGMRDIMAQVSRLISEFEVQGDLTIFVVVGPDGRAENFSILQAPSPEVAKAVAFIFVKTTFKPAVCGGRACRGEFPFSARLALSGG